MNVEETETVEALANILSSVRAPKSTIESMLGMAQRVTTVHRARRCGYIYEHPSLDLNLRKQLSTIYGKIGCMDLNTIPRLAAAILQYHAVPLRYWPDIVRPSHVRGHKVLENDGIDMLLCAAEYIALSEE